MQLLAIVLVSRSVRQMSEHIAEKAQIHTDLIHSGYSTLPVHAEDILFPEWAFTI